MKNALQSIIFLRSIKYHSKGDNGLEPETTRFLIGLNKYSETNNPPVEVLLGDLLCPTSEKGAFIRTLSPISFHPQSL
jgi:hypothetical protein